MTSLESTVPSDCSFAARWATDEATSGSGIGEVPAIPPATVPEWSG